MTKRDYEIIARAIAAGGPTFHVNAVTVMAERYSVACHIADALLTDNGRFNRARFLKACGFDERDSV